MAPEDVKTDRGKATSSRAARRARPSPRAELRASVRQQPRRPTRGLVDADGRSQERPHAQEGPVAAARKEGQAHEGGACRAQRLNLARSSNEYAMSKARKPQGSRKPEEIDNSLKGLRKTARAEANGGALPIPRMTVAAPGTSRKKTDRIRRTKSGHG